MSSIAGIISLSDRKIEGLEQKLQVMNRLQEHRGPDGEGIWVRDAQNVGLAHRRLNVIDPEGGYQPAGDRTGNWICCDGELGNFAELRREIGEGFQGENDAEIILLAYEKWGKACVEHLSGSYAFAIWDEHNQELFCVRDQFGAKPFYYAVVDGVFHFASEMKALLPFLPSIETDLDAFKDYLVFQFVLDDKTLFRGIQELIPAHCITVSTHGDIARRRYWQVYYQPDLYHTEQYFKERLEELIQNSVKAGIRSCVPIGGAVSGGVDSSIVASVARDLVGDSFLGFTGKFSVGKEYDETEYSRTLAKEKDFKLDEIDITSQDFIDHIADVIYHLDTPNAGPGSFSQYMVAKYVKNHRKVLLSGEGGDEIFGGYTRYLVAYFEECIKGAIDGTSQTGSYVVTYESIIPNLTSLRNYKPMLRSFWSKGLFDEQDKRYYQLINRAPAMEDCIRRERLNTPYDPFESYDRIFVAENVDKRSYLDRMTHFDFKTELPALLQVDDRMTMAHGVESRSPLLDLDIVEFAATVPASIKFKNGTMKALLRSAMSAYVPDMVMNRKDKMGFPTPFALWAKGDTKSMICDTLSCTKARQRELINNETVMSKIEKENSFARNLWGFFCLELWQQLFHDRAAEFRRMIE